MSDCGKVRLVQADGSVDWLRVDKGKPYRCSREAATVFGSELVAKATARRLLLRDPRIDRAEYVTLSRAENYELTAAQVRERFTGKSARRRGRTALPDALAVIGNVVALEYASSDKGRPRTYRHDFRGRRVRLSVGKGPMGWVAVIDGGFRFDSDRGFVDS